MNHETKFRGLTKEGQWVYGSLVRVFNDGPTFVVTRLGEFGLDNWRIDLPDGLEAEIKEVLPETVGQYSGQRDCKRTKEFPNGQEIYEGDILGGTDPDGDPIDPFIVKWEHGMYPLYDLFDGFDYTSIQCAAEMGYNLEVIGNIHQHKELLEAKP